MQRVLLVHNRYQQRGGEDVVFEVDRNLLIANGHHVVEHVVSNESIRGARSSIAAATKAVWNHESYTTVRHLIQQHSIDVVHCYNTFPLVSPAVYYAARAERVPVIHSIQNYRLVCPGAYLLRDGAVCERCVGHAVPIAGVIHKCYRGSYTASLATATMLAVHNAVGTWKNAVSTFLVPTNFMADKLREGGIPDSRITVRGNILSSDPGAGDHQAPHALFVGRVSPEKGISTMLKAWASLNGEVPLRIAGGPVPDGDAKNLPGVEWLGSQTKDAVMREMKQARVLIFPSVWYEGQPLVLLEALATGLPVIASDLGAMREMFSASGAGRLVAPSDAEGLALTVRDLIKDRPTLREMSSAARSLFLERHSADQGYRSLIGAYERAAVSSRQQTREN